MDRLQRSACPSLPARPPAAHAPRPPCFTAARAHASPAPHTHAVLGSAAGGGLGGPPSDAPMMDTAEKVYISAAALLKMLKHGASPASADALPRAPLP